MASSVPHSPKLYHIVHVDRVPSIAAAGRLWSDTETEARGLSGTIIGLERIKQRRRQLMLTSHKGLAVGECVPFYFCRRSVMLHVIHNRSDTDLAYRGGQEAIVHLQADLAEVVEWAESKGMCWAFTTSTAGAEGFEDHADLADLDRIDWDVVLADDWLRRRKDKTVEEAKAAKQAEFLVEMEFPWSLVRRIGVYSQDVRERLLAMLDTAEHRPDVEVRRAWYHP